MESAASFSTVVTVEASYYTLEASEACFSIVVMTETNYSRDSEASYSTVGPPMQAITQLRPLWPATVK